MNQSSIPKRSRALSSTLVMVAALLVLPAFSAQFQMGDEIKLTRDEPLYFHDQVFRQGKVGETFQILAHQLETQKVFVSSTDKDGKQIALSVAEAAITTVELDATQLRAQALLAAKAGRYADGLRIVTKGLRKDPDEPALKRAFKQIAQLQTLAQEVDHAKAAQEPIHAEAARIRRNAAVADRPNPFNSADTSGRDNAKQMRAEADQSVKTAQVAVTTAQTAYEVALRTAIGDESNGHAAGSRVSGVDYRNDPAVVPEELLREKSRPPSYEQTVEFINAKLTNVAGQKLWFGKKAQKMILYNNNYDELVVFNPAEANPAVKYSKEGGRVTISTSSGKKTFCAITGTSASGPTITETNTFGVVCVDAIDTEKVANALRHLIEMFGGKEDLF